MAIDGTMPEHPKNPIRVRTRRDEDLHELQYTGVLFDNEGRQYRYRTNEDLVLGAEHLIRTELEIEMIVRITDAWSDTGYR